MVFGLYVLSLVCRAF